MTQFLVYYIPKIEDDYIVARFETKEEAENHLDYITEVNPRVRGYHYIKGF
jgi:hypothetical protein